MSYPTYAESYDHQAMLGDYPIGDELMQRFKGMSKQQLWALQNQRFLTLMARAWTIPFYQRLWSQAGVKPEHIASLHDIEKLPMYGKAEIMDSVEKFPPTGDFNGIEHLPKSERPPLIFHTTSGTTGTPQPIVYGAKGREVQSLLVGRSYRFMGLKAGATVQSTYGHGMINGGHYIREAVTHYTNALFLSAGTGLETRSAQQVQLMKTFGVDVLVGFADYIKKLADVARDEGLVPGRDIKLDMIIGHLGQETRQALSDAWGGVELFDWYGVADTGCIASEGPDHSGLYVWEDAHFLEVLDVNTHQPVADGERGNMVVTCLYKDDVYPVIRFNTCDVTEVIPGDNSLGLPFRRIKGFVGRSDNMVKLRGINIYPHGVGGMLVEYEQFLGEFVCIVTRDDSGRDDMTVMAEVSDTGLQDASLTEVFVKTLQQKLGLIVKVELVAAGASAHLTQVDQRQKPLRLLDRRN